MSQVLIHRYLTELANLRKVGGTDRESVVREAFKDLLKSWGRSLDLTFIPEYELHGARPGDPRSRVSPPRLWLLLPS